MLSVKDREPDQLLVRLLWYVGALVSTAGLGAFAVEFADGDAWLLAWILLGYALLALIVSSMVFFREQARNMLTGLLVSVAIVVASGAILVAQEARHTLDYVPFPNDYSKCARACDEPDAQPYKSLGYFDRLQRSTLGVVTFATVASAIALATIRFLPLTVIVILGVWYMLFELIYPETPDEAKICLLFCCLLSWGLGWLADLRLKNNYGFWVNKLATWGAAFGLTVLFHEKSEGWRFLFLLLNACGVLGALYLRRPAGAIGFLVGAGCYVYSVYIDYFSDTLWFPFMLCAVGVVFVHLGWKLHRSKRDLEVILPAFSRSCRPDERKDPIIFGADSLLDSIR